MNSKIFKRLKIIFLSGVSNLSISLSNLLISYLVIFITSPEFWGSFVYVIITFDIAFNVISWGNRPYLIREYSLYPKDISKRWQDSFLYRTILLLIFIVIILLLGYSPQITSSLIIWEIARFIYQSLDAMIQYYRDFPCSIFIEFTILARIIIPVLMLIVDLYLSKVHIIYIISVGCKVINDLLYYRKTILKKFKIDFNIKNIVDYYGTSFPFLLLTFSGMLQTRMDLYIVAVFLSKAEVGKYQVLVGFLIFSQYIGSLFLSPFARNIFRLSRKALNKLEKIYISTGVLTTLILTALIYLILQYLYKLEFTALTFILSYFYILPSYFYALRNYQLGKVNKQKTAAIYAFSGSFVNLIFSFALVPVLNIDGALLSGVIAKIFLTLIYNHKVILNKI